MDKNDNISHNIFNHRTKYHPKYPLVILDLLKKELKVGKRYIIGSMGFEIQSLNRVLVRHVQTLFSVSQNEEEKQYNQKLFGRFPNYIYVEGNHAKTNLDDDLLDVVLVGQNAVHWDLAALRLELKRILRLNSFALIVLHQILPEQGAFGKAYLDFIRQYNTNQQDEYAHHISEEALDTFFENDYEQRIYANQLRLDWERLEGYYKSSHGALTANHPQYEQAIKALRALFLTYAKDNQVHLEFSTEVYYGLFNKYVPAISLRKNIFFTALRPFAFGFYVLVKMNIYFWKALYRVKEKFFPSKGE